MNYIKKLSREKQNWLNYQTQKKMWRITKKNRPRKKVKNNSKKRRELLFVAPQNFSMINNPNETNAFFYDIIKHRNKMPFKTVFTLDFFNVKTVTVDAIMHIIAILNDSKASFFKGYKNRFKGIMPDDKEAKSIFINSGLLAYVKYDGTRAKPQSDRIQIINGIEIVPEVAKKVCDFIQSRCGMSMLDTRPLYNVLIELMGNTNQHAYHEEEDRNQCRWYLFAEETVENVSFVFLDTGVGIPATVQKKFYERMTLTSDAEYIKSTLNGDFRTETKESHRGKGLPQINECCRQGILEEVYVIAGKGLCRINGSDKKSKYFTENLTYGMEGTLFGWNIKKRGDMICQE